MVSYFSRARLLTLSAVFLALLLTTELNAQPERGQRPGTTSEESTQDRQRGGRDRGPRGQRPGGERRSAETSTKAPTKTEAKPEKITPSLPQTVADSVKWRSIGPANMSGRITAITVYEKDPSIWWAATASGGLLKTVNNGNNFEHQFDDQATVSIGDVQVAQSNPDIVWVGTGESNPRNSVSWGDGVYKSTDGGATWKNMGLKKTFQTGALAIHPENPDVVWVGSLGRLWGPNPERGLFKTTDGGKTWKKTLFINDMTGVIDVQVNPKNPDELLVATYERKRDGFDGNDPVQRFGAGSGIYKSTDGGDSFMKVTEGLPSCKMGRIGLDYFESDPNVVVAIVESEKIGTEPENYSFAGLRGENGTDLGAKITRVTGDGPADKAGLKEDDVVVQADGEIITDYSAFLKAVHKKTAGQKIQLVVIRDRKQVDIEMTLGKKPKQAARPGRTPRTDFTGTLGGQAANLQDTQGPEGREYGGVYQSEDGGSTWTRINSLNPRPMYYSNIQIDPVDRNNIYICGTSLYKSKDGGKVFTNDGGSDGIHVDHHALWLDQRDPRHMILGNDGGIHVTYDRMNHWDHIANVAIGQFYHVGVDSNLDYNVYGGLQDNGSWGGPSRGKSGGATNSDWFRVGGGDGFITLADSEDPNQIYFESQNGGMGRIHLETGARGFIRPRAPRGTTYRFNWKTPFILSPHNSKIHYSAGNYVFRSLNKGDGIKAISPEITNSKKGAGSALSESPAEPGVIYVGTTDGAVWMTKNGGIQWQPLFYSPIKEEEKKKDSEKKEGDAKGAKPADTTEASAESSKTDQADPVSGKWEGKIISDRIPEDRAQINFTLQLKSGKLQGEYEGRQGTIDITSGTFTADNGKFAFIIEGERGDREFTGTIKDGKMKGDMSIGGGRFEVPFEASKVGKKDPAPTPIEINEWVEALTSSGLNSKIRFTPVTRATDDDITGTWKSTIENENLPNGKIEFSLELKLEKGNKVSGLVVSQMGEIEIIDGVYKPAKKQLNLTAENDEITIEYQATVDGSEMTGKLNANNGLIESDFDASRSKEDSATSTATDPKPEEGQDPKEGGKSAEVKKTELPGKSQAESDKSDEVASIDDPVSGKWTGELISRRGEQDFSLQLKRKSDKEISGTWETSQGEREISSGTFDRETKRLLLVSETDQFTVEIGGTLSGKTLEGEMDFNGGAFTMEFSMERTGDADVKAPPVKDKPVEDETQIGVMPTGEKSLSQLMPGSRWVSALEASRFKKERCYITFDGHRSNDDGTYVFVTNDYGKTWESLKANLPSTAGSARVIREDLKNENLLFLGCEFSSWYSIDGGKSWTRIKGGLPTVSVHEFAIHPTANEVVAGTHGRSLWVADISILRQLSQETLSKNAHLYQAKDAIRWQQKPARGSTGTRKFVGTNPTTGTTVAYSLGKSARQVELKIFDLNGDVVKEFEELPRTKGVHAFAWDLRRGSTGGRRSPSVASGDYLVKLKVDGQIYQNKLTVKVDPSLSSNTRSVIEEQVTSDETEVFSSEID